MSNPVRRLPDADSCGSAAARRSAPPSPAAALERSPTSRTDRQEAASAFPPAGAALDHVGIAVPSLLDALPLWRDVLGLAPGEPEDVASEGVRVVFLPVAAGGAVELLEPTRDESPVAKFLARRGPGVHHLSFRVASCVESIRAAEAAGIRVIPPAPRPGARGRRVAFFHPADTGGLLIEVCE